MQIQFLPFRSRSVTGTHRLVARRRSVALVRGCGAGSFRGAEFDSRRRAWVRSAWTTLLRLPLSFRHVSSPRLSRPPGRIARDAPVDRDTLF